MKRNIFNVGRLSVLLAALFTLGAPLALTSCKEDISEDAFAVATKQTITDYVSEHDSLSMIKALFDEVKLGNLENASVLTSVLSARGNYTVFAPTNAAVQAYVDSVVGHKGATIAELDMDQKKRIALNCVIDHVNSAAYETADFSAYVSTNILPVSNLNNRRLPISQVDDDYYVNNNALIIPNQSNIELSNGMLHVVDHVISPSVKTVAQLVKDADNMRIMGKLLEITGWADSLSLKTKEEEAYETSHVGYAGNKKSFPRVGTFDYQITRKVAYTAFVETDQVLHDDWGVPMPQYDEATGEIANWDEIMKVIEEKCTTHLGVRTAAGDYTNTANAVNQFVGYHLLDGGLSADEFVQHFNEYGYDFVDAKNPSTKYTVIVYDYYQMKSKPSGLLKITQLPKEKDFYINRISNLNNGFPYQQGRGDYQEIAGQPVKAEYVNKPGQNGCNIKISVTNGANENNALNGYYYPIDHVLINNQATRDALASERIRVDVITLMPEILSNELRGRGAAYFTNDFFSNIMNTSVGTEIYYLRQGYAGVGGAWRDYNGDQLLVCGRFDFVMKLPPVPVDGTYELRLGTSNNELRTMVTVYFGDSPYNAQPVGLPIDQREAVSNIPGNPWKQDTGDEETDRENDRNLRNQGYMKGPNAMMPSGTKAGDDGTYATCRTTEGAPALRRILTTTRMESDKTYYLRFKSAIDLTTAQFVLDYIELVPKSVFNGKDPEDIW